MLRHAGSSLSFTLIALGLTIGARPMPGQTMSFFREFVTPAIEQATAVAANGSDIYVVGNKPVSQGRPGRAGVSRYDSRGNQLWTREVSAPEGRGVGLLQVLAGTSGVYVMGYLIEPGNVFSTRFLRRYSAGGDEQWTHLLEGFGEVAADATGVYVTGFVSSSKTSY